MKNIFIISTIFLVLGIVFLVAYNIAFKGQSISTSEKESIADFKVQNEDQNKKIIPISDTPVSSIYLNKLIDEIYYYNPDNGNTYKSNYEGDKEVISNIDLDGFISAEWSPSGDKVISQFKDDGSNKYYIYDNFTKESTYFKNNVDYAIWDNSGKKIIYKFFDAKSGERSLNISNPDGSNWNVLTTIPFRKVEVSPIPKSSLISFWIYPDAYEESILRTISITGGDSKVIFSGRKGGNYLWSPQGDKALVSSIVDNYSNKIGLGVVNLEGEFTNIDVPTLTDKAVWSSDNKTVYYALPGSIPDDAVMPNDYLQSKFFTSDYFWKIDTSTGQKERIVSLEEMENSYDAVNLFLSSTENYLFFVNRKDGKLNRISL